MSFKSISLMATLMLSAAGHATDLPSIERGRYLARVTGCNDCHTPHYLPSNGNVPEKDWLIGVPIGWKGPWGTTYASNLRKTAAGLNEDAWVTYLKNIKTRPPMPYFNVNSFNEVDSRSLYKFLRSLGDHPQKIPVALGPNEKPTTPYFDMTVNMPKKK